MTIFVNSSEKVSIILKSKTKKSLLKKDTSHLKTPKNCLT